MRSRIIHLFGLFLPLIACASADFKGAVAEDGGRILIRDSRLTYEVDEGDAEKALRTRVNDSAKKLGGYVAGEDRRSMVLRIPSPALESAITEFETLGQVTEKSLQVDEVTAQHTDLKIRIDNAQRFRDRLQALLAEAKSVPEILEIEKELARVTEELERMQAQLRALDDRAALSTVTVSFENEVSPGPVGWVFYGIYTGVKWLFVWD